jgi:hypothetical protein
MEITEFDFLPKGETIEILSSNLIAYKITFTKLQTILSEIVDLLDFTDLKVLEIVNKVNEKYDNPYILNIFTIDMYHHMTDIIAETIGVNNIKERYSIDYDQVKERLFFRVELYKDGWEPEQIEYYLCKHLLKCDYHNTDKALINNMYHNVMEKLKITNKHKTKKVGRPNLPETVKEYLKEKHSQKTRKNMELTYDNSKKYKQIKDNLLTHKETEFLCNYLKSFPDNISFNEATNIIEKLRNLKLD